MSLWRLVRRWRLLAGLGVSPSERHAVCARMTCQTGGPVTPIGTLGGGVFFHEGCDDLKIAPFGGGDVRSRRWRGEIGDRYFSSRHEKTPPR